MKDINGREYAKVSEVVEGSTLEVDGDFFCMDEGLFYWVHRDSDGDLYVECDAGAHWLAAEVSEDGDYYIGMYLVA